MYYVIVASDGTGRTAHQALDAALIQFGNADVEILVRPGILSIDQVKDIVMEAVDHKAFIVHTIVADQIRSSLIKTARRHNVDTIDLMGPLLMRLSHKFAYAPAEKPGLFHEIHSEYFRRIEAMEFTFKHDDGLRVHEIDKADIVILGVSRTFKTPLSIYLAIKGWHVANVPIIFDHKPPREIFSVDPNKVFCLTTYSKPLSQLRKVRHEHLGGITGNYAEQSFVLKELKFARKIYSSKPNWTIINVTKKAIEEIASDIFANLGKARD
jgi:hypothetical protein